LGAIMTSGIYLLENAGLDQPYRDLAARIVEAARRTTGMVGDLLDFTRSRLGGGIPVLREPMDIGELAREVADEVAMPNPDAIIDVDLRGDLSGEWDRARLRQALTNLIGNAVQHGTPGTPVTVTARGGGRQRVRIGAQRWRLDSRRSAGRHLHSPEGAALTLTPLHAKGANGQPRAGSLHSGADHERTRRPHRGRLRRGFRNHLHDPAPAPRARPARLKYGTALDSFRFVRVRRMALPGRPRASHIQACAIMRRPGSPSAGIRTATTATFTPGASTPPS